VLLYLFTGTRPIHCLDSADTNDSGEVDISDAVSLLNFLFTGGAPVPSPGPHDVGIDPTDDALECVSYRA
jgi:hypothetical protein